MATSIAESASILIHPDALPCLKQRQLENLCVRLGIKATGKKAELIQRLDSHMSLRAQLCTAESQQDVRRGSVDEAADEQENASMADVSHDSCSALPNVASIRIISHPRESHFAALADRSAVVDDEMEEAGVVLPKSSDSHGSLNSLRKKRVLEEVSMQHNRQPSQPIEASRKVLDRIPSSGSLYPWKSLMASNRKKSQETLKSQANGDEHKQADPALAEMGLGLHASASKSSISSSVRRWLKGEGGPSVVAPKESEGVTPSPSDGVNASAISPKNESVDEALSPRIKRKRSQESLKGGEEAQTQPFMSPRAEVPQRRIKPRPSRAPRQSNMQSTSAAEVVSPAAEEPTNTESKMLAEMYRRLEAARAMRGEEKASSTASGQVRTPTLPPSPLKSIASRTRGRFSSEHEKQFGQMSSIATHYAATRREHGQDAKPSERSSSRSDGNGRTKRIRVESSAATAEAAEAVASGANVVTVAIETPPVVQRTEEEREVIRRKIALARHRRKSSIGGRKSNVSGGRRSKAHVSAVSPSAKLARTGIAQKISGAVRGFMGVASRGFNGMSTSSSTAANAPSHSAVPVKTSPFKVPQGPPQTVAVLASPVALKAFASTTKPAVKAGALPTSASKISTKRSTFDLRASLARKPVGYTPYSARETVEMLSGGQTSHHDGKAVVQRLSSVTFPQLDKEQARVAAKATEWSNESKSADESLPLPPPPAPPKTPLSPSSAVVRGARKTRSSASRAGRTSLALKSPAQRLSNAATMAAATAISKPSSPLANAATTTSRIAARRSRQPSLQAVNQQMASTLMRQRRMRTSTLVEGTSSLGAASPTKAPNEVEKPSNVASLPLSAIPVAAGHGSPRKQTSAVRVNGQGRGTTSIVEQVQTSTDSRTQSQAQAQMKVTAQPQTPSRAQAPSQTDLQKQLQAQPPRRSTRHSNATRVAAVRP